MTALADTGKAAIQKLAYKYDSNDNVLGISDGVTAANSQILAYDVLNRLTSASGGMAVLAMVTMQLETGCRSSTERQRPTIVMDQVIAAWAQSRPVPSFQSLNYTAAGNIASITVATGATTGLIYNQAERLVQVRSSGKDVADYTYDAFGRRTVKSLAGTPATVTLFEYDRSGRLLEESDGQGNPMVDYVYLDGRPIATLTPTGQVYYLHGDQLGTPQLATSSTQGVAWKASYQPFGGTGSVVGSITQNLRLPGQYADAETGWSQNYFRDYNPAWGRYLESDPIGLAGGLNTYAFVGGNPLKFSDIRGTEYGYDLNQDVDDLISGKLQQGGVSKPVSDASVKFCHAAVVGGFEVDAGIDALLLDQIHQIPLIKSLEDQIDETGKSIGDKTREYIQKIIPSPLQPKINRQNQ